MPFPSILGLPSNETQYTVIANNPFVTTTTAPIRTASVQNAGGFSIVCSFSNLNPSSYSYIKLRAQSSSVVGATAFTLLNVYVGTKASTIGLNAYDYQTGTTKYLVTWNSGSQTVTVPAGGFVDSDEIFIGSLPPSFLVTADIQAPTGVPASNNKVPGLSGLPNTNYLTWSLPSFPVASASTASTAYPQPVRLSVGNGVPMGTTVGVPIGNNIRVNDPFVIVRSSATLPPASWNVTENTIYYVSAITNITASSALVTFSTTPSGTPVATSSNPGANPFPCNLCFRTSGLNSKPAGYRQWAGGTSPNNGVQAIFSPIYVR